MRTGNISLIESIDLDDFFSMTRSEVADKGGSGLFRITVDKAAGILSY